FELHVPSANRKCGFSFASLGISLSVPRSRRLASLRKGDLSLGDDRTLRNEVLRLLPRKGVGEASVRDALADDPTQLVLNELGHQLVVISLAVHDVDEAACSTDSGLAGLNAAEPTLLLLRKRQRFCVRDLSRLQQSIRS